MQDKRSRRMKLAQVLGLRKRPRRALRQMQRQLNEAEKLARTGSWIWRTDGIVWSPGMYSIFGVDPEEALSAQRFLDIVHPEDRAFVQELTSTIAAGPRRREVEYRILPADGVTRVIAALAEVRCDAAGKPVEIAGTVQDITERKQAEEALRKALADRQLAVSAANIGLWDWDIRSNRVSYSKEWKQQIGYAEHEIGDDFAEWRSRVHPEDLPGAIERIAAYLNDPGAGFQSEFRLRHRNGSYRWILTQASVVCDAQGNPVRMLGSHLDITERKQAEAARLSLEAQLRQSQKMQAIGTLTGGIAHDFNNILLAISGNVQLALADCPPQHPMLTSLLEIERASARATGLVRSMLTFSRANESERKPLQLHAVVTEALRLLRAAVPAMTEIRTQFAGDVPNVLADAGQIHQIIMNLGTNAAQAIGERSGLIDVRVDAVDVDEEWASTSADLQVGRYVCLAIMDNGSGMSASTLERIFEPFFTTKPPGQGTGLGLAVVHGIVKGHGGAVRVKSESGRGTQIEIYFPATEVAPASEVLQPAQSFHGGRQRVLYLDDEESLVLLMSRLLERLQYRVTGFTDPALALAAFRERPRDFDVFISDLSMPHMSGFDVVRAVMDIRRDIPIIMTSGYVRAQDAEQAQKLGVHALILKPNTLEELAQRLHELFSSTERLAASG